MCSVSLDQGAERFWYCNHPGQARSKTASTSLTSNIQRMAPTGLSVTTSITTTLRDLSSPCSSPSCEYCNSSSLPAGTPSMFLWPKEVSTSPVEPSAQDVWAEMCLAEAEPPADNASSLVDTEMAAARARAGFVPGASLMRERSQAPHQLTPEQVAFNERVEAAIAKSSASISEAEAQLAAPQVAGPLTAEEKEEARRNQAWDLQYQKKNKAIDQAAERNQALFEDVMAAISDKEAKGIPIPDCSDLDLSWESNAGLAGKSSKSAAKWPGLTVLNLVAEYNG